VTRSCKDKKASIKTISNCHWRPPEQVKEKFNTCWKDGFLNREKKGIRRNEKEEMKKPTYTWHLQEQEKQMPNGSP
jgi:hypothetical protein